MTKQFTTSHLFFNVVIVEKSGIVVGRWVKIFNHKFNF